VNAVNYSKESGEGFDGISMDVSDTPTPHCMHWFIRGKLRTYEAKAPVFAVSARGPPH
jgi:hypothetical protein